MLRERAGAESLPSGPGEGYSTAYGLKINDFADPSPNPEDVLLAKEEGEDEETGYRSRRRLTRAQIHETLSRLPARERDALVGYYQGGQPQTLIAERMGISQPEVHRRIARAIQRARWLHGPATWFTSEDIERDLSGKLPDDQVKALAIYWRETSYSAVHKELGIGYARVWQTVKKAIASLDGKYRRGFDALSTTGKQVLWTPPVKLTGIESFLASRCIFVESGRVARVTLIASYERDALDRGRPVSVPRLLLALSARGVRPMGVRAPSSPAVNVAGFGGCELKRAA
jgi:hypothetical protein